MSTFAPEYGMTLREACVLTVAILGGQPAATDIHGFLTLDGWHTSRGSVKYALWEMRGAAVEIAVQGGPMTPNRYRLTEAARAWIAEGECRCG